MTKIYTNIEDVRDFETQKLIKDKLSEKIKKSPELKEVLRRFDVFFDENYNFWVKKANNFGGFHYDSLTLYENLKIPSIEEQIHDDFLEKYRFSCSNQFKDLEKEFILSLNAHQKQQYLKIMDEIHAFECEKELKLISFTRNYGRISFD